MSTEFNAVIEALWSSLGLSKPEFTSAGSAFLAVDGLDIELSEADDGRHIVVSVTAGQLSRNPVTQAEQVRSLLASALGNLAVNRACVCLDQSINPPGVVVRAIAPCDSARLDQLATVVGDVSNLVEAHERELFGHSRPAGPRPPLFDIPPDGMVIFSP